MQAINLKAATIAIEAECKRIRGIGDRLTEEFAAFDVCDVDVKAELVAALKVAEIALVNSIPVVTYPGDGPLVQIRAALALAEEESK